MTDRVMRFFGGERGAASLDWLALSGGAVLLGLGSLYGSGIAGGGPLAGGVAAALVELAKEERAGRTPPDTRSGQDAGAAGFDLSGASRPAVRVRGARPVATVREPLSAFERGLPD